MHAPPWKFDARDCVWTRKGRSRAGSWPRLFRGGDKKPDRTRTGLWIQRHYAREASAASSSAHTTSNGRLLGERQRDGRRERRHRARRCSVVSARKFQNSYLMILGFHMPPDFTSAIPRSFQGAPRTRPVAQTAIGFVRATRAIWNHTRVLTPVWPIILQNHLDQSESRYHQRSLVGSLKRAQASTRGCS